MRSGREIPARDWAGGTPILAPKGLGLRLLKLDWADKSTTSTLVDR